MDLLKLVFDKFIEISISINLFNVHIATNHFNFCDTLTFII
jgi:hypothetical protein